MDLPPGLRLSIEDRPALGDREAVEDALTEFNRPFLRDPSWGRIGIFAEPQ